MPMRSLPTLAELQEACDLFNEHHAIGDVIEVHLGEIDGPTEERTVSAPAEVLGSHAAIVYVTEAPGCIALSHVKSI